MNPTFHRYRPSDQQAVKDFVINSWKEFGFTYIKKLDYDLDDPGAYYLTPGGMFFVLKDQEKIIGTIGIINKGKGIAEFKRLYIDMAYRGKKLGSLLVDTAIAFCRDNNFHKIEFETNKIFTVAHTLYQKRGFTIVEEDTLSFYMEKML